jgi:hypothetical protein
VTRVAALLLGLAIIGAAQRVRAQSGDPTAATELFRLGRAAMNEQRYDVACRRFAESERLDPKVGTLMNLARCEEAIARLAAALRTWDEAVQLAHNLADDREKYAVQRREEIALLVPQLTVTLASDAPADTRVQLDGRTIDAGDLGASMPIETGRHVVVASAPARAEMRFEVDASPSESQELEVKPGPILFVGSSPLPPSREVPNAPSPALGTQKTVGLTLAGAGVLGLGVGAVFGLMADSAWTSAKAACGGNVGQCSDGGVSTANTYRRTTQTDGAVATVSAIVGSAALVAGAVLFFAAERSGGRTAGFAKGIALAPNLAPGREGLDLIGAFW